MRCETSPPLVPSPIANDWSPGPLRQVPAEIGDGKEHKRLSGICLALLLGASSWGLCNVREKGLALGHCSGKTGSSEAPAGPWQQESEHFRLLLPLFIMHLRGR